MTFNYALYARENDAKETEANVTQLVSLAIQA